MRTLITALILGLFVNIAKADVIFYFANPGELTETSAFSATNGSSFSVDIVANMESAADTLSAYSISVQFDSIELDMISAAEFLPVGFQFNLNDGVFNNSDPDPANHFGFFSENIGGGIGQVSSFEAGTFGNGPSAPTSFRVGSIEFRAVAVNGGTADIDLSLGFFLTGIDIAIASDGITPITPSFRSAGVINAVPEPSGLALAGLVCGLTVGGRRRR